MGHDKAELSWPKHLPQVPPPNTIRLGLGFNICIWEDTHIQSTALAQGFTSGKVQVTVKYIKGCVILSITLNSAALVCSGFLELLCTLLLRTPEGNLLLSQHEGHLGKPRWRGKKSCHSLNASSCQVLFSLKAMSLEKELWSQLYRLGNFRWEWFSDESKAAGHRTSQCGNVYPTAGITHYLAYLVTARVRGRVESSEDRELMLVWMFGLNKIKPFEGFGWVSARKLLLSFSNASARKVHKIDPLLRELALRLLFQGWLLRGSKMEQLHEALPWEGKGVDARLLLIETPGVSTSPTTTTGAGCWLTHCHLWKRLLFFPLSQSSVSVCGAKENKDVINTGSQAPFGLPEGH